MGKKQKKNPDKVKKDKGRQSRPPGSVELLKRPPGMGRNVFDFLAPFLAKELRNALND